MGGIKQGSDDYCYICSQFLDPNNDAYDIENYDGDDIWKDPNREFFKNKSYDQRQFKYSLSRLVNKLRKTQGVDGKAWKLQHLISNMTAEILYCILIRLDRPNVRQ